MSILHYFSKNPDKRAKFIFNLIAPLYSNFDKGLQNGFRETIKQLNKEINISEKSVLDIGSGTGAWSASFINEGASLVHGIDFSEKMIKQAKKNHPGIKFTLANGEELSNYEDASFDIVTASFVLHGFNAAKRKKMLHEMHRVSKKYIVLQDFIGKTPFLIRILEFLEKSDYKSFKKNVCNELKEIFPKAKKIPAKYGSGLYIAEKS